MAIQGIARPFPPWPSAELSDGELLALLGKANETTYDFLEC